MTLDTAVARYVSEGWGIESRTPGQAVLAKKAKIGWFWNILLSILTGGLWLIVVIYKVVNRKTHRMVLTADSSGNLIRG